MERKIIYLIGTCHFDISGGIKLEKLLNKICMDHNNCRIGIQVEGDFDRCIKEEDSESLLSKILIKLNADTEQKKNFVHEAVNFYGSIIGYEHEITYKVSQKHKLDVKTTDIEVNVNGNELCIIDLLASAAVLFFGPYLDTDCPSFTEEVKNNISKDIGNVMLYVRNNRRKELKNITNIDARDKHFAEEIIKLSDNHDVCIHVGGFSHLHGINENLQKYDEKYQMIMYDLFGME